MTAKMYPLIVLLSVSACGPITDGANTATDPLIIGALDWQDVTALPVDSTERARSRAVGYLSLPARSTRCTAFIIAPDVIMTNYHCVPGPSDSQGAVFEPTRESGLSLSQRAQFACTERLGGNENLDFALLRCPTRPGDRFGVVALQQAANLRGAAIYVVQQNCDYYTEPQCEPTKVLSRGRLTAVGTGLSHDADTLGGSSGSPIFSAALHEVVGLHNAGSGDDGAGRGTSNWAVPMSRIVPYLAANFPSVALEARAPVSGPSGLVPDGLEPNDSAATATPVSAAYGPAELTLVAGDVDVFRIEVGAASQLLVDLSFFHGLGDLDAVLTQGSLSGAALANGVSGDDNEHLEVTSLAAGTYYLKIYGYEGASNAYSLSVGLEVETPVPAEAPPAEAPVMEPNEEPHQAPVVAIPFTRTEGLNIADAEDLDYFAFDSEGGPRSLTLSFDHSVGDLDLFVEDASGQVVATSNGVTGVERIVQDFGVGRYFVKVAGYASATGPYGLQVF